MDFISQTSVAALAVALVLLYNIIWRTGHKSNTKALLQLPQPSGALPLVGHLPLLGDKPLHRTFAAFADKYGPVFQIRLGGHPALVISSREAIKECFTTADKLTASRPRTSHAVHFGYNLAAFGFAPYGPYWTKIRKLTVVEMLSTRSIDSLRHGYESEIDTLIEDLATYVKGNSHVKVVMNEWMERLTFNMMTKMIAGKRYFSYLQDVDDPEAHRVVKLIKELMHVAGEFVPSDLIPMIGWLGYEGRVLKAMKRITKDLDALARSWIEEHSAKSGGDEGHKKDATSEKKDFIDVMLSVIEDDAASGHTRDTIIKATVVNLMLAGSDTTSTTLTWAIAALLNHKHDLKRAQEEIDLHVGRDRKVKSSDLKNLVYLHAIVKETLRLYPAGPLLLPHEAIEDCNIQGYHVSKGTHVFANVWKLHRDPSVWVDPEKFSPERFIRKNGELDEGNNNFEFLPFGLGRRACPGAMLATQVSVLTLARLIQGFNFDVPVGETIDMEERTGIFMPKLNPLQILLTPRKPLSTL